MTEYRRLGKSGLSVSVVGLGCNNLGRANTVTEIAGGTDAVVHAALDAGVTLFDVADNYGREPGLSETMLGKALAGRRDDAVVATKFGMDMPGRQRRTTSVPGDPAATSCGRRRRRCAGSAPTGSTCTSSIPRTR